MSAATTPAIPTPAAPLPTIYDRILERAEEARQVRAAVARGAAPAVAALCVEAEVRALCALAATTRLVA